MDRASDFGSDGWGFESLRTHRGGAETYARSRRCSAVGTVPFTALHRFCRLPRRSTDQDWAEIDALAGDLRQVNVDLWQECSAMDQGEGLRAEEKHGSREYGVTRRQELRWARNVEIDRAMAVVGCQAEPQRSIDSDDSNVSRLIEKRGCVRTVLHIEGDRATGCPLRWDVDRQRPGRRCPGRRSGRR